MGAGGTTNGKRILLVIAAAAALAACDGPRDDPSEGAAPGADASQHRPAPSGSCTASYEAEDHLRASAPGFGPWPATATTQRTSQPTASTSCSRQRMAEPPFPM
jgi:hypothetical protein